MNEEHGFRRWHEGRARDRAAVIGEIHERVNYGLRRFARISHHSRLYPSIEDTFRETLFARVLEADRRRRANGEEAPDAALADKLSRYEGALASGVDEAVLNRLRQRAIGSLIHGLGRARKALFRSVGGAALYEVFASAEAVRPALRARAFRQLERVRNLYGVAGFGEGVDPDAGPSPLHPSEAERAEVSARLSKDGALIDLDRFLPAAQRGSMQREWFNFWKVDGAVPDGRSVRLWWEHYSSSQNFTVFEDFQHEGPAKAAGFFEDDARITAINTGRRAIDTVQSQFDQLFEDEPFEWVGDLYVACHIWIAPIQHVLENSRPDGRSRNEIDNALFTLEGARDGGDDLSRTWPLVADVVDDIAQAYFGRPDRTRLAADRANYVVSRVVGGRALLISDLQPAEDDGGASVKDLSARHLILDIGMTDEQRGRLVGRLIDIATFRTLALRDYPYIDKLTSLFDDLATHVSQANAEFVGRNGAADEDLTDLLHRIDEISAALSAANFFVQNGVTGRRMTATTFAELIRQQLAGLREERLPGFQTLEEYLTRFFRTAGRIERMYGRYENLRQRIAELNQLVRSQIELRQLQRIVQQTEAVEELREQTEALRGSLRSQRRSEIAGLIGALVAFVSFVVGGAGQPEAVRAILTSWLPFSPALLAKIQAAAIMFGFFAVILGGLFVIVLRLNDPEPRKSSMHRR